MARAGRRRSFWLLVGSEDGRMDVFTMSRGEGRETLPVFSYREEAEAFLRLGSPGPGWRVRQSAAGEVLSVLHSLRTGVGQVALDPLPEVCGEELVDLVSLDRERFARSLAGETGPLFARQSNGHGRTEIALWREPSEDRVALRETGALAGGDGSRDGPGSRSSEDAEIPDYAMRDFGLPEEARDGSEATRRAAEDRDAGRNF